MLSQAIAHPGSLYAPFHRLCVDCKLHGTHTHILRLCMQSSYLVQVIRQLIINARAVNAAQQFMLCCSSRQLNHTFSVHWKLIGRFIFNCFGLLHDDALLQLMWLQTITIPTAGIQTQLKVCSAILICSSLFSCKDYPEAGFSSRVQVMQQHTGLIAKAGNHRHSSMPMIL